MSARFEVLDCVADAAAWDAALDAFEAADPCQYADYVAAYAVEGDGASGSMALYREDDAVFALPALVTPVALLADGSVDLETPHGYGGPLSTTADPAFLARAWAAVDDWARDIKAIAEFSRLSTATDARRFAHPDTLIVENRFVAIVEGIADVDVLSAVVHQTSRTRARKAARSGFRAQVADRSADMPAFRAIYDAVMARNLADESFYYGDAYYAALDRLPADVYKLIGVWDGDGALCGGVLALRRGAHAVYHLAATEAEASRLGAGNLVMHAFCAEMLKDGARRIVLGGGRSTDPDDSLLRFKRKNATGLAPYFIGLRVLNKASYDAARSAYRDSHGVEPPNRLLFYR